MKFIHAADLHIDSPMRGLNTYDGAPVDQLRGATRKALIGLVDLALREKVDLVLLAGDIFDRDLGDFRAALFFREQLVRLVEANIRVFIVKGNHDAEGQISKRLPDVSGVHVFNSRTAECIDIERLGVAIHGRSFPDRVVGADFIDSYHEPISGRFNIGVLHTSLTGRSGHDPYAPTDVATLTAKNYDYFALGHVHAREVVQESNPRIVFPGNLQGRHVGETGPKGCELVVVEGNSIVSAEHVSLDVVRWHDLTIDATGLEDITSLATRFHDVCRDGVAGWEDLLHAMRITVHGESALHGLEARDPGSIAAVIQAATQDFGVADLWIESVRVALRSPVDREVLAQRPDAVGEVVRLVDELLADDVALHEWALANLDKLPVLPAGLADIEFGKLTKEQLRALLRDSEATVLSKLSTAGA